ncbi:methyl-accepting chemotaxis protein [Paenibacillus xanthanilyticus]|uniref:Methyl-accepting chemotaxis protein n=1 Tax=Paenibacillus xanthanilyticus TaxID=1783531 RepID=A0ABV8KAP5_9BACL
MKLRWKREAANGKKASNQEKQVHVLRDLTNESLVISDQLAAAVEEVNQSIGSLGAIADRSSSREGDLRASSQLAAERIEQAFSVLREVTSSAEEISATAGQLDGASKTTGDIAREVEQSLDATDGVMRELNAQTLSMERNIQHLQEQTSNIEEINAFIQEIVEQTSLLALNASIEAAHAGEFGRGFSIVAQEIKKLAEQSNEAVKRSSAMVRQIEGGVAEVVRSVELEKQAVERGALEMNRTKARMERIVAQIRQVDDLAAVSSEASRRQSDHMARATHLLGEAVESVQDTMHSVDDTLELTRQQRRQIGKLDRVRDDLNRSSAALSEAIARVGLNRDYAGEVDTSATRAKLTRLAADSALAELGEAEHERRLTAMLRAEAEIEAVWSNRSDGSFIFSLPAAGLLNAKGRVWWKKAMEGISYQSEPYISAITKQPCVTVAVPIRGQDGTVVGVMGADIAIRPEGH